jgi:hypothetical protein
MRSLVRAFSTKKSKEVPLGGQFIFEVTGAYFLQGDDPDSWYRATPQQAYYIHRLVSNGSGLDTSDFGPVSKFTDSMGHPIEITYGASGRGTMLYCNRFTGVCRLIKTTPELRSMGEQHEGAQGNENVRLDS